MGEVLKFTGKFENPFDKKLQLLARRLYQFDRADTRRPEEREEQVRFLQKSIANFPTSNIEKNIMEVAADDMSDTATADSLRALIRELNTRKNKKSLPEQQS